MKWFFRGLIFPALLLTHSPLLLAFSVSYEQVITTNGAPMASFKVTVQDQNLRVESQWGGLDAIMIRNDTGQYNYIPSQNTATRIPLALHRPNLTDDLPNYTEFLQKNRATVVGSEEIQGRQTDIYQFTDPIGLGDTKAWVWKDKQFPIKIEVRNTQGTTVVELNNVQFDIAVEPAVFQIPDGVEVVELEAAVAKAEDLQTAAYAANAPSEPAAAEPAIQPAS